MFKLVVNASPIIVLAKIGRLDLLPSLSKELVIPEGVGEEIRAGSAQDPAKLWMEKEGHKYLKAVSIRPEILLWNLGRGESEVLSFAYTHKDFVAVVDDRAARRCAQAFNIPVKGTLALLVISARKGLLSNIKAILNELELSGFYLSPELKKTILKLTEGE